MDAFSLVAGVSSVLYLSVWGLILVCYLKYLSKYPERHAESAFKMPAGRVMSWAGIIFFITILIMLGFAEDSRQALIAAPVWVIFMVVLYRLLASTRANHTRVDFDAERIRALEELRRTQENEHQA